METLPKTKREIAQELLTELFRDTSRILVADAVAAGKAHGIAYITMYRAARALGITSVHTGRAAGIWELVRP
jgi:Ni,Fe-hydrogenase maturation factor